jgi:hypothetical protein
VSTTTEGDDADAERDAAGAAGHRSRDECCEDYDGKDYDGTDYDREVLRARVRRAFALGWHVAQLYHAAVPRNPEQAEVPESRLVGLSGLNPASRYRLQLRMVEADIRATGLTAVADADLPSTLPIEQALVAPGHSSDQVRAGIYQLHVALLEALTVADFRLGKSYGLGRALAETALVPMSSPPDQRDAALSELLKPGRILELTRWLSALKSELPDHAAYATNRTLETWCGQHPDVLRADMPATVAALNAQGRVWRALLSGEKAAVDMLNEGDYLKAAEALVVRSGRLLASFFRHFWWAVLSTLVIVGLVIWWIYATHLTSGSKVAASIATVAAGLGLNVKGASGALAKAATRLEGPLWQSELDESIAIAATRLPGKAAEPERRSGNRVGELRPSQDGNQ